MSPSKRTQNDTPSLDYWHLFQTLPEPHMLIRADDPTFTIVDVNVAREKLTGISRERSVGKPLFEVFPPSDTGSKRSAADTVRAQLRKVIRTRKPVSMNVLRYDLRQPDGSQAIRFWRPEYQPVCDASGKVTHILASSHDITSELSVERRLTRTEKQLEVALTAGKVGSWTWTVDSNVFTFDSAVATILGLPRKLKDVGLPMEQWLDMIHTGDRKRVKAALHAAQKSTGILDEEYRTYTTAGDLRWVLVRGQVEVDDGVERVIGVIIDITEQHDLQAQVKLAREQDKLNRKATQVLQTRNDELEAIARTKDEFVALASHQLRTPATAVKQYLGMVLQGYVGDISDMQAEMLGKAFESNERQIQIINQILNAARVDTGRLVLTPGRVDVCTLVQGIANDMKSMFEAHGHALDLHIPKKPLLVGGDLGYLRMAIENIVNNAIVYTPDGGKVTVKLSHAGKRCRVTITDTGVGIRKSDLGKLFIKFSRIHNPLSVQAGGSGIGLYLTSEIIRLHNGTVDVDSRLGKGTTFAISLPLVQNTT